MRFLLPFILLFSFSAFGQDLPIVGKISDIQGKTKVYLNADSADSKTKVEKYLNKKKIFTFVGDPKDAEFILDFKTVRKSSAYDGTLASGEDLGEMTAYFFNTQNKKVVAWQMSKDYYKNNKRFKMPKKNEEYLTTEFLNAYSAK